MSAATARLGRTSPYRSFLSFRYADRECFCGRTEEIQNLTAKAVLYRLVLLFGDTGAGKSSLLNAGLWPALRQEGFQPERLRVRPSEDEPILVERVEAPEEPTGYLPTIFDKPGAQKEILLSLAEFGERVAQASTGTRVPVLVFDQFEELFTVVGPVSRALRDALVSSIIELVGPAAPRAKFLLTMREDFLGHLELVARSYPQVFERRVRLGQLDRSAAEKAILKPFERQGVWPTVVTAEAAKAILDDFQSGDPHATIHSTHLQIVCGRLWQLYGGKGEITSADYRNAGGVRGLLEGFLDSELEQLQPAEDRPRAYNLLGHLVTEAGTRDVVSENRLKAELGAGSGFWFQSVLAFLEQRHLVNRILQRDAYYVEIASEYLIARVERYNREADAQARQRELRQARRRNWALAAVAAVLMLLLTASISLWRKAESESRAKEKAQAALKTKNGQLESANSILEKNQQELQSAYQTLVVQRKDLATKADLLRTANEEVMAEKSETERSLRNETASKLFWQVNSLLESDPQLAGRLAIEAVLLRHDVQSDAAARASIQRLAAIRPAKAPGRAQRAYCPNGDCAMIVAPGAMTLVVQPAPSQESPVFSPDGRYSAFAKGRGAVIWQNLDGREIASFTAESEIRGLRFSADSEFIAVLEASRVAVRNVLSGRVESVLPVRFARILSVSERGRFGAFESEMEAKPAGVQLWDLQGARLMRIIPLSAGASFGLSPAGLSFFCIRSDSDAVRDTLTDRVLLDSAALKTTIAAAFSPDSRFLASLNTDGRLMVWDLSDRATLILSVAAPAVSDGLRATPAVGFSGKDRLVAVTTGATTRTFSYETSDLVRDLCSLIDRPLSPAEWKQYIPTEAFRDSCSANHH
jgi:hypothetical protein